MERVKFKDAGGLLGRCWQRIAFITLFQTASELPETEKHALWMEATKKLAQLQVPDKSADASTTVIAGSQGPR